ncbi:MAG: sulfurtransferase TusA family protein [Candidatus Margulisiibacteriota bacterium]
MVEIDRKADLRGVSCPLNYVKTKLQLEELEAGQVLAILLDDGEPIVNVPRSAKEDGNQILEVNKIEDYYQVLIKKG